MSNQDLEVHDSTGSVFEDMGMPDAAERLARYERERDARLRVSRPPLSIGTRTQWGAVDAVGWVGERYNWLHSEDGTLSMLPASVVEPPVPPNVS
jgi:hypothetical protein